MRYIGNVYDLYGRFVFWIVGFLSIKKNFVILEEIVVEILFLGYIKSISESFTIKGFQIVD